MAQEGPLTPEKQLLKLIETPGAKGAGAQARKIKRGGLGLFSAGAWAGRLSFFKNSFGKWSRGGGGQPLSVRAVNRILILGIFAVFAYLITDITLSVADLDKEIDIGLDAKKITGSGGPSEESLLREVSFYLDQVRERDIFEMGRGSRDILMDDGKKVSEESLEKVRTLRLVGISWSKDPDAMIEDTDALRTFFVQVGDMVGDFKVLDISKDKVLLISGEGEKLELK